MATIISLKRRIIAAQNVSKTTKAMQMIAASKLKRGQNATLLLRPYFQKLMALLQNIKASLEKSLYHDYMITPKRANKDLLVIFAPDKGLCGTLISNLTSELIEFNQKNSETIYLTIGKKTETYPYRFAKETIGSFKFGTTLPSFDMVFPILNIINEYFLHGKVKSVKILYSKFINVFSQNQEFLTLLPVQFPQNQQPLTDSTVLFEPSAQVLLPPLLNHYLETVIFQVFLESYICEQAARMIAMQNATDNAVEISKELRLEYNKARQEKITNEILDIASTAFSNTYE